VIHSALSTVNLQQVNVLPHLKHCATLAYELLVLKTGINRGP